MLSPLSPSLSSNLSSSSSQNSSSNSDVTQCYLDMSSDSTNDSIQQWYDPEEMIKDRRGNALKRNTILKLDHFPSGTNAALNTTIPGAPNYREMRYNVHGVAQPTIDGLTNLVLHLSNQSDENKTSLTWISTREEPLVYVNGRPFVLRDYHDPHQNTVTFRGMSVADLEDVERRLKEDVIWEAKQADKRLLVHYEDDNGKVHSHFEQLESVHTPKDVFSSVDGLNYHRVPISTDQSPENMYFDALFQVLTQLEPTDPVIFNCGIGAVRTTLAGVIAQIVRRSQLHQHSFDHQDPERNNDELSMRWENIIKKVNNNASADPSLLPASMTEEWKNVLLGDHYVIRSLYSTLPNGVKMKQEVDMLIDQADDVVHLREVIVENLLDHIASTTEDTETGFLKKASLDLRRYYMLICFAYFVNVPQEIPFTAWLRSKKEIRLQYRHLRRKDPRDAHFKQLLDANTRPSFSRHDTSLQLRTASVLLPGRILKEDDWRNSHSVAYENSFSDEAVQRAAQPSLAKLQHMMRMTRSEKNILWINLRQEPIVYIGNRPYALRNSDFVFHNIRDFRGISGPDLEELEMRLKMDVVREIEANEGRLLLHREDSAGRIRPEWESVNIEEIYTFREVMDIFSREVPVIYARIPITAEKVPDLSDFDEFRTLLVNSDLKDMVIIMNCQSGRGRSKTGMIISALLRRWLNGDEQEETRWRHDSSPPRFNYDVISGLVRVLKNGQEAKFIVDNILDDFGPFEHLRETIHYNYANALLCVDAKKKRRLFKRGLIALERYFLFICFQAFLGSTSPNDKTSFREWMKHHSEIKTIARGFRSKVDDVRFGLLVPSDSPNHDLLSANMKIVQGRSGRVLAHGTILKNDAFPGCQKKGLKEQVGEAFNFRRVSVKDMKRTAKVGLPLNYSRLASDLETGEMGEAPFISGCSMPSKDAIKAVLEKMGAGPGYSHKVYWTCLREEPVLYINARPYVLRSYHNPLKNLETTGIATERVEQMEIRMKQDVLKELQTYDGRLLLHDETVIEDGEFELDENWQDVDVSCVQTPAEMFESIQGQGYQVDYCRIATTDEKAPIPRVFDLLAQRQKEASEDAELLFNCQMGRGRTTTGMITACLMSMVLDNDFMPDEVVVQPKSKNDDDEYSLILNLVSVLRQGRLAKTLADHAINMCDHMQNLRTCVTGSKKRLDEIPSEKTQMRRHVSEATFHYLVRYFYVIVFAHYLLETKATSLSFEAWLEGHPEISNLIKLHENDFS